MRLKEFFLARIRMCSADRFHKTKHSVFGYSHRSKGGASRDHLVRCCRRKRLNIGNLGGGGKCRLSLTNWRLSRRSLRVGNRCFQTEF